jgi:ABC-2 type transport system permease protein
MTTTPVQPPSKSQSSQSAPAVAPLTSPGLLSGEFLQETLALARRLFIQLQRRPSTLVAGIIQPLIWLLLFGALFKNVPQGLFGSSQNYGQFLTAGILVFTAFSGALNAGLPVMFDREFGFLNRLLVAPLASRFSIEFAAVGSHYWSELSVGCWLARSTWANAGCRNCLAARIRRYSP